MGTGRSARAPFAAAFVALFVFACKGGGGGEQEEAAPEAPAEEAAPAAVADAGTVKGVISFEGTPPAPKKIDMSEEPTCADKHQAMGGAVTEDVVVKDGKLKNVFVYIKEGLSGTYPKPSARVTIDQNGCVYNPHVLGIQPGQTLVIKNSDGLLHNINAKPDQNRGFNISQPTNMESTRTFTTPEVMIPVECDVHGWMKAYIGVLDHSFYSVTADQGAFALKGLPAGTYVIEAWHEKYGTQTQTVTVAEGQQVEVSFTFGAPRA